MEGRDLDMENLSGSLVNPLFYDFFTFLSKDPPEKEKSPQVKSPRLGTRMLWFHSQTGHWLTTQPSVSNFILDELHVLAKTILYWEALRLLSTDCSSPCTVNSKGKQSRKYYRSYHTHASQKSRPLNPTGGVKHKCHRELNITEESDFWNNLKLSYTWRGKSEELSNCSRFRDSGWGIWAVISTWDVYHEIINTSLVPNWKQ